LPQTMLETSYCLHLVVQEGISYMPRRSEVCNINGAPSTPGYLPAPVRDLSNVLRALTKVIELAKVRKTNGIRFLYQIKKNCEKICHHVSIQESLLCRFRKGWAEFFSGTHAQTFQRS